MLSIACTVAGKATAARRTRSRNRADRRHTSGIGRGVEVEDARWHGARARGEVRRRKAGILLPEGNERLDAAAGCVCNLHGILVAQARFDIRDGGIQVHDGGIQVHDGGMHSAPTAAWPRGTPDGLLENHELRCRKIVGQKHKGGRQGVESSK